MRRLFGLLPLFLAIPIAQAADPVSFERDVAPILVRSCLGCHNDMKADSGLNMATFALLKAGGETLPGETLIPGDPDASYLIEVIRPDASPRMPLKLEPLSETEIALLERWVREGALFDGRSEAETRLASLVNPLENLPAVPVTAVVSDPVTAVVFAAGGTRLAAAHGSGISVFDVGTGTLTATLSGHPGPINALGVVSDSSTLYAAGGRPGQFGFVAAWDLDSGEKRRGWQAHSDSILALALSPDGRTLATASYDHVIKLWTPEGELIRDLREHTDAVHAVAFSPDGRTLASASADRTVKLWDPASGERLRTLSDATAEQYALAFAPDGLELAASGADRVVRVYDLSQPDVPLARQAIAHDAPLLLITFSADGSTLYTGGEDRRILAWSRGTLDPLPPFPAQSDWPLAFALSPDGSSFAIGRYDGSLDLVDASGKVLKPLLQAPALAAVTTAPHTDPAVKPASNDEPPKPELIRPATLAPPSPRGGRVGTTVRLTLTGNGVGRASEVVFPEPGITTEVVPEEKPDPNRLIVDAHIAPEARIGPHAFGVRTPLGTPGFQTFVVEAYAERPITEPESETPVELPGVLVGAIESPGDVDRIAFEAVAGQNPVFAIRARGLGSALNPRLSIRNASGQLVGRAESTPDQLDPILSFAPTVDGTYTLEVADLDFGGSANHFYRITAGPLGIVQSRFPLGLQQGTRTTVEIQGVNLSTAEPRVGVDVPAGSAPGTLMPLPVAAAGEAPLWLNRSLVVAEGPQTREEASNDTADTASAIAAPGGVAGRIEAPGDLDHFVFVARAGTPLIIEAFSARLGSPTDLRLEILDVAGNPIPRALLKPVAETQVAFRDHAAAQRTIRLTTWDTLAIGDYLLAGRELLRIAELPRNPDDDALFWGLGSGRLNMGNRIGQLDTTPEHHPMSQPMRKVEIYRPDSPPPVGGATPMTLYYRNDDGPPALGRDPRITFTPPADGSYVARVDDARGNGGPDASYHLVVRTPRPGFKLTVSPENPNIPRGAGTVLIASIDRVDGFSGAVDVSIENLPPGVRATSTRIEPDFYAAEMLMTADPDATLTTTPAGWTATGRARVEDPSAETREMVETFDPGGPVGGWVSITPEPNVRVIPDTDRITLRPGDTATLTLKVERGPGFTGRVPIDVRNLPTGVRVLNIGLNGVLVTESQTERTVTLQADPGVVRQERALFAVGRCEAAGTEEGGAPILLEIRP